MKHMIKKYLYTIAMLSSLSHAIVCQQVHVGISYGELIDKITILTIKSERITDPEKLHNIITELNSLRQLFNEYVGNRTDVIELMTELKIINETLWNIEDMIRIKENIKEFGNEFIQLARSVYITNDQRFIVKRKIDTILGSHIIEEKSYENYA